MTKKKKQVKSDQEQVDDIYKNYEPDGRDLAEHLASQEQWVADNPDSFDSFRNKMNEIVDVCVTKVKEVTQGHP